MATISPLHSYERLEFTLQFDCDATPPSSGQVSPETHRTDVECAPMIPANLAK